MRWLYVNVNIQKHTSNSELTIGFCYFILFGNLTCHLDIFEAWTSCSHYLFTEFLPHSKHPECQL